MSYIHKHHTYLDRRLVIYSVRTFHFIVTLYIDKAHVYYKYIWLLMVHTTPVYMSLISFGVHKRKIRTALWNNTFYLVWQ